MTDLVELRAENERLRKERDEARANHEYFAIQWDERGYALKALDSRLALAVSALEAADYLIDRYRKVHAGKTVRDLDEAEVAYAVRRAAPAGRAEMEDSHAKG